MNIYIFENYIHYIFIEFWLGCIVLLDDKDKLFNRLSQFGVFERTTKVVLKSIGRIYHLVDKKKNLEEAKEEICKALLGLDNIEMGSKVDKNSTKL